MPYPDQHGLSHLLIKFHLYHFSCVRSLLFCCMYVNGGLHASSWIGTGGHVPAAIVWSVESYQASLADERLQRLGSLCVTLGMRLQEDLADGGGPRGFQAPCWLSSHCHHVSRAVNLKAHISSPQAAATSRCVTRYGSTRQVEGPT